MSFSDCTYLTSYSAYTKLMVMILIYRFVYTEAKVNRSNYLDPAQALNPESPSPLDKVKTLN